MEKLRLPDGSGDASAASPPLRPLAGRGRGIVGRAITGNSSASNDAAVAGATGFTASSPGMAASPAVPAAASSSADDDEPGADGDYGCKFKNSMSN